MLPLMKQILQSLIQTLKKIQTVQLVFCESEQSPEQHAFEHLSSEPVQPQKNNTSFYPSVTFKLPSEMTIGSNVRAVSPQISESSDFLPTDEAHNEA